MNAVPWLVDGIQQWPPPELLPATFNLYSYAVVMQKQVERKHPEGWELHTKPICGIILATTDKEAQHTIIAALQGQFPEMWLDGYKMLCDPTVFQMSDWQQQYWCRVQRSRANSAT